MANAKPSRPGNIETAGKLIVNIPREEKVVRMPDGRMVRRTEYDSGTVRETEVFAEDHKTAGDFVDPAVAKEREAMRAEIRAELEAEAAEKVEEKKPEPKPKAPAKRGK